MNKKIKWPYNINLPFMLIGQDGMPFTAYGLADNCLFSSPYFIITSVSKPDQCVLLEVLFPCCCGKKLVHTKSRVLVDLTCFAGVQVVSKPVIDCLQKCIVAVDQICLPFELTNEEEPKPIWEIQREETEHIATVTVLYFGTDEVLDLVLNTGQEEISIQLQKSESRSITVCNLQSLEIENPKKSVKGKIDIQLNFLKRVSIYF